MDKALYGHSLSPLHHGRCLAVEDAPRLLALRRARVRVHLIGQCIGAFRPRPPPYALEPALQMREIVKRLALTPIGNDPWIAGDISTRIGVAGEDRPSGAPLVRHPHR